MTDDRSQQRDQGLSSLSVDPDLLAQELAAEEDLDPLDAIEPDDATVDASLDAARACDEGLIWLQGGHGERLQALRVFCEHRDPRAVPLLLPLLKCSCPVERMSAVYALGRNPSAPAVEPLLQLLEGDSNAFVRKATAWSLGNFPDAPVLNPLIRALQTDVAAVRLWWPAGLGAQPRYNLTVAFAGVGEAAGAVVATRTVGFRQFALVTGNDTDPAYFAAAARAEGEA